MTYFDDLKLGAKTLIPMIAMALLFAVAISAGTFKLYDLARGYGRITGSTDPAILRLSRASRIANEMGRDAYRVLVNDPNDAAGREAYEHFRTAKARGDRMFDEAIRLDPLRAAQYRAFRDRFDSLYEAEKAPVAIGLATPSLEASRLSQKAMRLMDQGVRAVGRVDRDITDLALQIQDFNDAQLAADAKITAALAREASDTITMMVALGLLSLFGGLGVAIWTTKFTVAAPLIGLGKRMQQLAQGDLSVVVEGQGRGDEVGAMARAVQVFKDNALRQRANETVHQTVFDTMSDGVVVQDMSGAIVAVNPAAEVIQGRSAERMLGRDSHDRQWRAVREDGSPFPGGEHPAMVTLRTGAAQANVVMGIVRPAGDHVWISIDARPVIYPGEKTPHAVVTTFHDITARKADEERQTLLVHELNHRVKNTLAIVQSVANQTLSGAASIAAFGKAFNERLLALSQAHDVLTRNDWSGANIREIVTEQLRPYKRPDARRCELDGPDVRVSARVAVTLGMMIGELATNAAKYGALSVDQGRVLVSWERLTVAAETRLKLVWREQGGPAVVQPQRKGFGARLIERGMNHELHGRAKLTFDPSGLVCEMEFPLEPAPG